MIAAETAIIAAIAIPAAGAGLIAAAGRWPNVREAVTLATAGGMFLSVLVLLREVLGGARPAFTWLEVMPGISIAFHVEPLGVLFALIASGLWIVTSCYSIGYMRGNREHGQTRFYVCFAVTLATTMGVALAANVFTLFLFYELLTLITYPLVTHHGTPEARRGGRTYVVVLLGTSLCLLAPAVVFTWHIAGTTDFVPGGILGGSIEGAALTGLLLLYVFGIGKAAVMPLHRWLPAAMVAPTPVSALLHAVAVVKAGVFSVVKVIVYIFGVENLDANGDAQWLAALAGFTIIAASVVALHSDNLKRRLAYSTVSQLSYVVLAAAVLTPLSVVGAALHIAAHAFGKITLFFAAGAIYTAAHKTEVSQLDGIGRRMPWTMGAFAVGALSMIGLPPAAGFLSKWCILSGAMAASQWAVVAVLTASTLLTAGYFVPIVYRAFFREPPHEHGHAVHGEAPLPMVAALTVTAAATVVMFFAPEIPLALARGMVEGGAP